MPEPQRERVLAAVQTRLEGIHSDLGFYTTPVLVTRMLRSIQQYNEFPVIGIGPADDTTLILHAQREAYLDNFTFWTRGYVKGNDTVSSATWFERLWDDIVRRILQSPNLDGTLGPQVVRPGRFQVDLRDGDFAAFAQYWTAQLIQSFEVVE
jgi:hypothetical protein